jgi:hypothetical protein
MLARFRSFIRSAPWPLNCVLTALKKAKNDCASRLLNQDGAAFMQNLDATTEVRFHGDDPSATVSLALNIQQLRLPRFDEYSIDLAVDGRQEASIPLFVRPAQ